MCESCGTAHKFEAWPVGNNPQAEQHTCSFAPRFFWNAREGVALGARPRELLKVRKILKLFVGSKGCVVHESGVLAGDTPEDQ